MQLTISRTELARVVGAVGKVVEARTTIPILSNILLAAEGERLHITGTDLDIQATASAEATIVKPGSLTVSAKLLGDIARKAGNDTMELSLDGDKLSVKSGRSKFALNTLPASDFPDLKDGKYDASFEVDLAALVAPTAFAISTEETRYYLNGVFLHLHEDELRAVATDGHRLSRHQVDYPGEGRFNGVIVPRKTVGMLPKGKVNVSVGEAKIRIASGDFVLTSKLIDGTFPDYERVIPRSNENRVVVDRDAFMKAADRVATVSSERGRAIKLSIAPGSVGFTVNNADAIATDEIEAGYSGEPIEIGFNALYLREILSVLPAGDVVLKLRDGGSPAVITGTADGWDGVLMPMRV
ncbi:DNA polymerase III subunit beta [Rhizobium aethiopicum]|nr:DNA polymerase III subunit beta [Rhizobium aethiopicum]